MTHKDRKPELEPASPQTLSSVIKAAEGILRVEGEEGVGMHYGVFRAKVPIHDPSLVQVKPGIEPTITIGRPIGELAKIARWGYEITYRMQDADTSRHVLILNGEMPQAEISDCSSFLTRQPLTEVAAQQIVEDLSRLASE